MIHTKQDAPLEILNLLHVFELMIRTAEIIDRYNTQPDSTQEANYLNWANRTLCDLQKMESKRHWGACDPGMNGENLPTWVSDRKLLACLFP